MKKVLIIQPIHEKGLDVLRERPDVTYEMIAHPTDDRVKEGIADADGIIVRLARIGADVIDAAPNLRVVSRHGVGYDSIDIDALTRRRIPLTLVGDVNAVAVAEHTLYMMLALARRGFIYDRAVRTGRADIRETWSMVELWHKTVLIAGFGRIGREVAGRCRAFDMEILVFDPYVPREEIERAGYRWVDALPDALAAADLVTLHVPLSDETRHLIGAPELRAMKPTAFLINVSRGGIVDETALDFALTNGDVGGAGLDVFVDEPPPTDHPLLKHENVVLSPHAAALTDECAARMAIISANNVLGGLDGRLDANLVVNKEVL